MVFLRVSALCEMQKASSKIWTWVVVFISNGNNYDTRSTARVAGWLVGFKVCQFLLFFFLCVEVSFTIMVDNYIRYNVCTYIIIIMWGCQHEYPWPSLATLLYRHLFPESLPGYTLYRHRAVRSQLVVLNLLVHVKRFTGVYRLWVRPYFSSSVSHVCFV